MTRKHMSKVIINISNRSHVFASTLIEIQRLVLYTDSFDSVPASLDDPNLDKPL